MKIDFSKSPPFCFIKFKRFFDQILWQIHFLNIDFKSEVFVLKCFRVISNEKQAFIQILHLITRQISWTVCVLFMQCKQIIYGNRCITTGLQIFLTKKNRIKNRLIYSDISCKTQIPIWLIFANTASKKQVFIFNP